MSVKELTKEAIELRKKIIDLELKAVEDAGFDVPSVYVGDDFFEDAQVYVPMDFFDPHAEQAEYWPSPAPEVYWMFSASNEQAPQEQSPRDDHDLEARIEQEVRREMEEEEIRRRVKERLRQEQQKAEGITIDPTGLIVNPSHLMMGGGRR